MVIEANHGDRNGGHLIGNGGLISVPVVQEVSVATKREDWRKYEDEETVRGSIMRLITAVCSVEIIFTRWG